MNTILGYPINGKYREEFIAKVSSYGESIYNRIVTNTYPYVETYKWISNGNWVKIHPHKDSDAYRFYESDVYQFVGVLAEIQELTPYISILSTSAAIYVRYKDYTPKPSDTTSKNESNSDERQGSGNTISLEVYDDIANISKKYGNTYCKEAAAEIQNYLSSKGLGYEQIEIHYSSKGFIVSDTYGTTAISENGVHVGTLFNGKVYDNIHHQGLPYQQWLDDFYGLGERTIITNSIE